jgi:hypothetical protein
MDDLTLVAKSDLRSLRYSLLVQTDWRALPDSPLSDSEKAEWIVYRQALRDLPANNPDVSYPVGGGELQNFTLPEKPE